MYFQFKFAILLDEIVYKLLCYFYSTQTIVKTIFIVTYPYFPTQAIVKTANPSIVEPLLNLLKTLHLEVQFEGMQNVL